MKLLIATDHRYYRERDAVFDTYCFDRSFFDDYRAVFDEVRVAARLCDDGVPNGAERSDGDGVEFIPLADVRGARWAASPRWLYCRPLYDAVRRADAVCVRIPSVSGWFAHQLARRAGKPTMFELIGDPRGALRAVEHGRLRSAFGTLDSWRVRRICRHAVAGSYVSRRHLQLAYPAGPRTRTASISSIRLPASEILPARAFSRPPDPLVVSLVASLVPVKRHDVLLRGVAEARRHGAPIRLELVGGGGRRRELEQLADSLGIADVTAFHGHVADRAAIDRILDGSDVFAMTSASEGMPRAMIEAMARGVPAIGASAGGIAELLDPDQRFASGDYRRLGEMLVGLQRAPARLASLSERSVARAREYTSDILSARRIELLETLRAATAPCRTSSSRS